MFSESPGSIEGPPHLTGTDGINRQSCTEASAKPQKSDTVPCEQGLVHCTEGMYLPTLTVLEIFEVCYNFVRKFK